MALTDATDLSNPSYVVDLSNDKDFQSPSSPSNSVAADSTSTDSPVPPEQLTMEEGKVVSFNFDDLKDVTEEQLFQVRKLSCVASSAFVYLTNTIKDWQRLVVKGPNPGRDEDGC